MQILLKCFIPKILFIEFNCINDEERENMEVVEFEITKKDCQLYCKDAFKIPMVKKANKMNIILIAYFIISFCFGIYISSIFFNGIFFILGIVIFTISLYTLLYKMLPNNSGSAIFRAMKGSDLKRKITINEEGFTNINSSSSTTYNWKSVIAVHDAKNNIIIFIGNALGVFIPKRAFQSEFEAKKFYTKILEYYNNAKNS